MEFSTQTSRATLVRLSEVEPQPVRWLWPGRFASGKFSILSGDPGLGKSFLTLDMAARVSTGRAWPDGSQNRGGGVVLLSAEDDIEDTIVPRLIAADADLSRIVALKSVTVGDSKTGARFERSVRLTTDLEAIEGAIASVEGCRLVVIDPLSAYGGAIDSHKDKDVRGMMAPFADLVAKHDVCGLGVMHLNKNGGTSAIYRTSGSLAFVAAARAVWLICRDREQPTGRRRLMLPSKNNLANDTSGLAYSLNAPNGISGQPVVVWEDDPVTISADDALEPSKPERQNKTDAAICWLSERMVGAEMIPSEELEKDAEQAGIHISSLKRARMAMNVQSIKRGGRWYATLPS